MDSNICSAIHEFLSRYAANQLTTAERIAVERHVATCLDCRAELREWLTLNEWLAQSDATLPPDIGAEHSLAAIHARLRQPLADRTAVYDLDNRDGLKGIERSGLPTMPDQNSPHHQTDQQDTQPTQTLREQRPSAILPWALWRSCIS
jgi:putative zinc finger protein